MAEFDEQSKSRAPSSDVSQTSHGRARYIWWMPRSSLGSTFNTLEKRGELKLDKIRKSVSAPAWLNVITNVSYYCRADGFFVFDINYSDRNRVFDRNTSSNEDSIRLEIRDYIAAQICSEIGAKPLFRIGYNLSDVVRFHDNIGRILLLTVLATVFFFIAQMAQPLEGNFGPLGVFSGFLATLPILPIIERVTPFWLVPTMVFACIVFGGVYWYKKYQYTKYEQLKNRIGLNQALGLISFLTVVFWFVLHSLEGWIGCREPLSALCHVLDSSKPRLKLSEDKSLFSIVSASTAAIFAGIGFVWCVRVVPSFILGLLAFTKRLDKLLRPPEKLVVNSELSPKIPELFQKKDGQPLQIDDCRTNTFLAQSGGVKDSGVAISPIEAVWSAHLESYNGSMGRYQGNVRDSTAYVAIWKSVLRYMTFGAVGVSVWLSYLVWLLVFDMEGKPPLISGLEAINIAFAVWIPVTLAWILALFVSLANFDAPRLRFLTTMKGYFQQLIGFERVAAQILPDGNRFLQLSSQDTYHALSEIIDVKIKATEASLQTKQVWTVASIGFLGAMLGAFMTIYFTPIKNNIQGFTSDATMMDNDERSRTFELVKREAN